MNMGFASSLSARSRARAHLGVCNRAGKTTLASSRAERMGVVRRKHSDFFRASMVGADLRAARYRPSTGTARLEVGPPAGQADEKFLSDNSMVGRGVPPSRSGRFSSPPTTFHTGSPGTARPTKGALLWTRGGHKSDLASTDAPRSGGAGGRGRLSP